MKILYFVILSLLLSGCWFVWMTKKKEEIVVMNGIKIDTLTRSPDRLIRRGDTLQFIFNFSTLNYSFTTINDGAILLSTNGDSHFMTSDNGVTRYCDDNNDTIRFFNNVGYGVTRMIVEKSGKIYPPVIAYKAYIMENGKYVQLKSHDLTLWTISLESCTGYAKPTICEYNITVVP